MKKNLPFYFVTASAVLVWMTTIILWISLPAELTLNLSISVLAVVLLISAILMRAKEFKTFYSSSRFKAFSVNLFSAMLIFCILALINHLAYKNPFQWDFSAQKSNTLTTQSKNVLKKIAKPITAQVFSPKQSQNAIVKMLELYQFEKNDITINLYDPVLRPDLVQKYEVKQPVAVIWELGSKTETVLEINELGLTNGLIRIGRDHLPKIYYDSGHGQNSLSDQSQSGRYILKEYLINSNFAIQEADTKRWSEVPSDADVLMIWGPKSDFMEKELVIIGEYLDRGGKLLMALDPDLNLDPVKDLRKFLLHKGIVASNSLVIDSLNHVNGSNGTVPIAAKYSDEHPITKGFPGQVFFPLTGFVTLGEQAQGMDLVLSTQFPASWGEMNPREFSDGKVKYNEGQDVKGPVAFGVAAKIKTGGQVVFFANSTFIDNAYAKYAANHTLLLNSLSWLTGDDELISFDLPGVSNDPVFISSPQLGTIFFFSVIFAPLALFSMAVFNYRRRRVK